MTMWYGSIPWSTLADLTIHGRRVPVSYRGMFAYQSRTLMIMYWPVKVMQRVASFYLRQQFADPSFIRTLHISWKEDVLTALERGSRDIEHTDLKTLSDKELKRSFLGFVKKFRHAWTESIFHDSFDLAGGDIIERELIRGTPRVSVAQVETLLAPVEPLVIQRERTELASIAALAQRSAGLRQLVLANTWTTIHKNHTAFYGRVDSHRGTWKWMLNDYERIVDMPFAWFAGRIRYYLTHPDELQRDRSIPRSLKNATATKRMLIKKLRLTPRQRAIIELLSTVQVWRDERKAMSQAGSITMRRFAHEFSRRSTIPITLLRNAFWWEIDDITKGSPQFKKVLRLRTIGLVHRTESSTTRTLENGPRSAMYQKLLSNMISTENLHGMPAFTGIVRGRAHYMMTQSDFPRFKPGEILIAPNTRPEYVSIMKKAGAIVTEEGGITSHAAIVSRELCIPAIVGVQGVLEAFRNGDLVEVDAIKGTVKKVR